MTTYMCYVGVAVTCWTLWDADRGEIRSTESLGQDKAVTEERRTR